MSLTGNPLYGGLHPDVVREITRLGGVIDERFTPTGWREETPVGERLIPAPIQAVLSVKWPKGVGHLLITNDEDLYSDVGYEVTFPQTADGDPIAEDRACFEIGFDESTQYLWVIDLDDDRPDDPLVYEIDHGAVDDDEDLFECPKRLSRMLAGLTVFQPPPEALFPRACARGDLATVAEALRAGAPLGPVDDSGLTPLHLAAISRSVEVVRALLAAGADPNAAIVERGRIGYEYVHPDWHIGGSMGPGDTPLHYAVDSNGPRLRSEPLVVPEVVQALLDGGADPHACNQYNRTPLNVAASFFGNGEDVARQVEVLQILLAAGCDPNHESRLLGTPLMQAKNHPELVAVLLDAGADPSRLTTYEWRDLTGLSALHAAALWQQTPVLSMRLLLNRAATPDVRTSRGVTPLHCAVWEGAAGLLEALVEAGADVNARLEDPSALRSGLRSQTPLAIARELGHDDVAAFLISAGATTDNSH